MAVDDLYEGALLYSLKGEKCANVLHFEEIGSPATVSSELDLAGAIESHVWPAIKDASSQDLMLQQIKVRRYHPTTGGSVITAVDETGSIAVDTLPSNNCVVLSMYTGTPTRKGRGRLHLPGIPDTHNQDGLLPASVTTLYTAIITALTSTITGADGGDWRYGIGSSDGLTFQYALYGQLRSWIHTLRGRRAAAP